MSKPSSGKGMASMDNLEKREVHVSNESLMDGVRLTVAVGPAFLFREGVQYGHAIEYLRAVVSRAWTQGEAQIYPCA